MTHIAGGDVSEPDQPDGPARRPSPGLARPSLARPSLARPVPPGGLARRPSPGVVRAAPSLARVAAVSAWHVVSWSVGATVAGANYVARRAVDGEPATAILQEAANDLRSVAWRALGMQNSNSGTTVTVAPAAPAAPASSTEELQRRGSELLRRSNDVHDPSSRAEDTHPAFSRILSEITPDEARILRFIFLDGPQPALDIRTNRPLGIGSVLVAGGLSMIAEHAGLRSIDRLDQYLTNLSRLGLIDFSKEQVSNPTRYQVIEAQPKVVAAMKRAGRAPKLVQRSIRLNSFGEEFVRTCLPLTGSSVPQRGPRPGLG